MRIFIPALFAVAAIASNLAAQTSHSASTSKSTAHRAHRKSTGSRASSKPATTLAQAKTPAAPATSHRTSKSGKKPPVVAARRSTQQQPTLDRYREIQQALADKGYFAGQPDGNWRSESIESLKRFQHDQNLTEDGKIGSLSLIALGLGPRRVPIDAGAVTAAPQSPAAPASIQQLPLR